MSATFKIQHPLLQNRIDRSGFDFQAYTISTSFYKVSNPTLNLYIMPEIRIFGEFLTTSKVLDGGQVRSKLIDIIVLRSYDARS